ncbi:Uncharacterised protein [Burkholderia pseudomallei]|nr:Uncharacterised protein [Burkholderia pseudomallei]
MKRLVYERTVPAGLEQVGLRLYQTRVRGFVLERFLVQGDDLTLVQLFPIPSSDELEKFAHADPHYAVMRSLYSEVTKIFNSGNDDVDN